MLFKKSILVSFLVVLTIISFGKTVHAAYMYIYSTHVPQAQPLWCWAASAENVIRHEMTPTRTQWDAVRLLSGTVTDPYPNTTGTLYQTELAAEYISNNTENYTYKNYATSFTFLFNEIYNYDNLVILAAGYYDSTGRRNGGHCTVLYGVDNSLNTLAYYDPATDRTYKCSYADFCNGSYNGRKYDSCVNNTEY